MIHNDQELATTQERIARLYSLLAQLRVAAAPEEFPAVAGGYRTEIARMRDEVLEYLTRHASQPTPAEAA
jgi:predicted phosphoribosyltransferase